MTTARYVALLAALLPATAYAQQPWGRPYVPPPPPAYRGTLPSWVPPTLPPGSPSLMIPNPPYVPTPAPPPMPRW